MDLLQPRPDRRFQPSAWPTQKELTNLHKAQVHYDARLMVSHFTTTEAQGRQQVHRDTLVVSVDGAGTIETTSYSIFFGPDSLHNEASLLPDTAPQKDSGAGKFFATLVTFAKIARCLHSGLRSFPAPSRDLEASVPPIYYERGLARELPMVLIKNIVIVSDYSFLVDVMCDQIRGSWSGGWKTQGFEDNDGRPTPEELDYLRNIDKWTCYLETNGVKVQFWSVPPRWLRDPRNMVFDALGLRE